MKRHGGPATALLLLLLTACGPPQTECGPDTCDGCCLTGATGTVCVEGTAGDACGRLGQPCRDCGIGDDRCVLQACIACRPENCDGCCTETTCRPGTEPDFCGAGGAACDGCTARAQLCSEARECAPCGPDNCSGCCRDDGSCEPHPDRQECGLAGASCTNCAAAGQLCVDGGCTPCGPDNCTGCCGVEGCTTEEDERHCGTGGVACDDCLDRTLFCHLHACVACGVATCAGCCDERGQCQWGSEDDACGYNGGDCVDCRRTSQICDPAWCRDP